MDGDRRSANARLWSTSPENLARVIAKRPGLYLGGASYERALGFLHGLARLASAPALAGVGPDEFSAESGSSLLGRITAVERDLRVDDREAILALEPLLAEALTALQELDEA